MFNPNPAFLLVQKLKLNQPQGLYTRSQGWNRKKKQSFQSAPSY
jgi:hypothetical protein